MEKKKWLLMMRLTETGQNRRLVSLRVEGWISGEETSLLEAECAKILETGKTVWMDLGPLHTDKRVPKEHRDQTLDEVQRAHIQQTLQRTGWVVSGPTGAAMRLGLKATTLEARMRKLGITRPNEQPNAD